MSSRILNDGNYYVTVANETIFLSIKCDGTLDTAYGMYKYTVNDFR